MTTDEPTPDPEDETVAQAAQEPAEAPTAEIPVASVSAEACTCGKDCPQHPKDAAGASTRVLLNRGMVMVGVELGLIVLALLVLIGVVAHKDNGPSTRVVPSGPGCAVPVDSGSFAQCRTSAPFSQPAKGCATTNGKTICAYWGGAAQGSGGSSGSNASGSNSGSSGSSSSSSNGSSTSGGGGFAWPQGFGGVAAGSSATSN